MGLLGKLISDSFKSADGVVKKERKRLEKESLKLGLKPVFQMIQIGEEVTGSETMREGLKTLFGTGQARVDRLLIAGFEEAGGNLRVVVPFSGKETLAAQFSMNVATTAPARAILRRSAMGSWGFGKWESENSTFAGRLEKEEELTTHIEWDQELPGDYKIKLGWGLQIQPLKFGETRICMQSGLMGLFSKKLGLEAYLKKLDLIKKLLKKSGEGEFSGKTEPFEPTYAELLPDA